MAFIYKRKRSPFFWIRFRDPNTGEMIAQSTGFKVGNAHDKRCAQELEAEKTLLERATGRPAKSEIWAHWVRPFLATHYSQSQESLARYLTAWRSLEMYFKEMKIPCPRNLTREHCLHYFEWRKTPDLKNAKYRAGHNTTLLDMKTLALVMKEAMRRGYAKENPARELGIKRAPRKIRPEYPDEIYDLILREIEKETDDNRRTFLRNSFLIARWHGVRLNETWLNPQTQVWQQPFQVKRGKKTVREMRWVILFKQKGDKRLPKLLHPELVPLFAELKQSGARATYEKPDAAPSHCSRASRIWHDFLKRIGVKDKLPGACFHSLRISAASRLARAGVSQPKAMEYLSHASSTVHEAYIRWRPEDVAECHDAL